MRSLICVLSLGLPVAAWADYVVIPIPEVPIDLSEGNLVQLDVSRGEVYDAPLGLNRLLTNPPGCTFASPQAVNRVAQIAGYCNASPTVWDDGTPVELPLLPAATMGRGLGINDDGLVVGWNSDSGFLSKAFAWSEGAGLVELTVPPRSFPQALANDVNDDGTVVGWATGTDADAWNIRAAMWSFTPGVGWSVATSLGALGADPTNGSEAVAINDFGVAVGYAETDGGANHAAGFFGGGVVDLGTLPGDTSSEATDINEAFQVIGESLGPDGLRAFLYEGGTMSALEDLLLPGQAFGPTPITQVEYGVAIDDDGVILAGGAQTPGAGTRWFMMVPEEDPLTIRTSSRLVGFFTSSVTITGATPGRTVYLLAGRPTGKTAVPGCTGTKLPLGAPSLVASGTADAFGVVNLAFDVPSTATGSLASLAAAELSSCSVTDVAQVVVD